MTISPPLDLFTLSAVFIFAETSRLRHPTGLGRRLRLEQNGFANDLMLIRETPDLDPDASHPCSIVSPNSGLGSSENSLISSCIKLL